MLRAEPRKPRDVFAEEDSLDRVWEGPDSYLLLGSSHSRTLLISANRALFVWGPFKGGTDRVDLYVPNNRLSRAASALHTACESLTPHHMKKTVHITDVQNRSTALRRMTAGSVTASSQEAPQRCPPQRHHIRFSSI